MNGTNGNEPGYPENALVPYPVIVAATKGDPDAMKIVLQHFSGYIDEVSEYFPELLESDIKEIESEVMQLA